MDIPKEDWEALCEEYKAWSKSDESDIEADRLFALAAQVFVEDVGETLREE